MTDRERIDRFKRGISTDVEEALRLASFVLNNEVIYVEDSETGEPWDQYAAFLHRRALLVTALREMGLDLGEIERTAA